MQLATQENDKFFAFGQYPQIRNLLDGLSGIAKRFDEVGALNDIKTDYTMKLNKHDKNNLQHLQLSMGIKALEIRLLKHYNIMNIKADGSDIKNRRNMERYLEVRELNNILLLFIMLIYTKYSAYSGPVEIDGNYKCKGADPTFVSDDKIFADMQGVISSVEQLFRKMLNYKYDIKDSENILDYGLKEEELLEKVTFKQANLNKGTKQVKPRSKKK